MQVLGRSLFLFFPSVVKTSKDLKLFMYFSVIHQFHVMTLVSFKH